MKYVRSLNFKDTPDYETLISYFNKFLVENVEVDWINPEKVDRKRQFY